MEEALPQHRGDPRGQGVGAHAAHVTHAPRPALATGFQASPPSGSPSTVLMRGL